MSVRASSYFNLYKFPLGRCVFALRAVARRAREVGAMDIARLAERAALEAQTGFDMELRARHASRASYPPETKAMDGVVDQTLGGVSGYLDVQIRVYPGEPVALAAERMQEELFPEGVGEISKLPFAEEHERINILLDRAGSADLAADMALLPELPDLLARLRQRNHEYGELLRTYQRVPAREDVLAIQDKVQDLLAGTVGLIQGLHHLNENVPGAVDHRAYLLGPVAEQNEALRRSRRRRRVPTDVDPVTGEEIPSGDADPANDADDTTAEDTAPDTAPDAGIAADA